MSQDLKKLINGGARWMDESDLAGSTFTTKQGPRSLTIGKLGNKTIYFDGDESLATTASPGGGKTMSQVIPSLLHYPGSVFVLDVKDEIYKLTAGHRQKYGKVIRFAPTDLTGNSHAYNPLDLLDRKDPHAALKEARIMANMLLPEQPGAKDRYWNDKGREYTEAFIMLVAFLSRRSHRNLTSISELLAVQTKFEEMRGYDVSDTKLVIEALEDLGKLIGIPSLAWSAKGILNGLDTESNALESVFDTARAAINPITSSPTAAAAMLRSDWHPLDLRNNPGTSVYICLKPDEIKAYAPIVRIMFQQHVSQLTRDFTQGAGKHPPITFFLDEMPQLGHMPNLPDIIEVGRGAGLRLWMFMQMTSQMREAYGTKAMGLIEACKVRCYMSPDNEAAKDLMFALGDTLNPFTGEKEPLVKSHEFAGAAMKDDIIALARGEHPARLGKTFAFNDPVLKRLMAIPAPPVRRGPKGAAVAQTAAATARKGHGHEPPAQTAHATSGGALAGPARPIANNEPMPVRGVQHAQIITRGRREG